MFVEFVRRHESELRAWIHCRVICNDGTQEILQKTFCKAWCSETFDPEHQDARAWVFRTAKNLIFDAQHSKESASISLDDLSLRSGSNGSRPAPSAVLVDRKIRDPMARMIEQENIQTLHVALGMLADQYRDVLERYYMRQEGNQYQIAQAIGLSIAAFNSRLNRARKELTTILLRLRQRDEWVRRIHDS